MNHFPKCTGHWEAGVWKLRLEEDTCVSPGEGDDVLCHSELGSTLQGAQLTFLAMQPPWETDSSVPPLPLNDLNLGAADLMSAGLHRRSGSGGCLGLYSPTA